MKRNIQIAVLALCLAVLGARSIDTLDQLGMSGLGGDDRYMLPLGQLSGSTEIMWTFMDSNVDSVQEEISEACGDLAINWITLPSSPGSVWLASSDTGAGMTVKVEGAGATGVYQSENIGTDGTTPVVLLNAYYRVFKASIVDSSVLATGEEIYLSSASAFTAGVPDDLATVIAYITAAHNQSLQSGFSIPIGAVGLMTGMVFSVGNTDGTAATAHIELEMRPLDGSWLTKWQMNADRGTHTITFPEPILIPTGADIRLSARDPANNGVISGAYFLRLLPSTLYNSAGYMQ